MEEKEEYKFNCEKCDYHTNKQGNFSRHLKTKKHKKNYEKEIEKEENKNKKLKYSCELCDYYTNNKLGFYQHKRTKKHKKNIELNKKEYNCNICNKFGTDDQNKYLEHIKLNHIDMEKEINKVINNTTNNTTNNSNINSNNTINQILNIHLNTDKSDFKLMLENMNNNKLFEMLGGVFDKTDFNKDKLWSEEEIQKRICDNLINKTLENKIINESLNDLKITETDLKNKMIQLKDKESGKYMKYKSNYVIGNILKNNLELTSEEHSKRIKEIGVEYIKNYLLMDVFSKCTSFKQGYNYNYNGIINNILVMMKRIINKVIINDKSQFENDRDIKEFSEYFLNSIKQIMIDIQNNN
jgi:hypothetical protein